MTPTPPAELNKSLTLLLNEQFADTGFSKKRISTLRRKAKGCEQFFSFYFTRDRGLPGNLYTLSANLAFSFPEANKFMCEFLGKEYDAKRVLGAQPLYTVIPNGSSLKYKYCSDEPLSRFAEMVSEDFHSFALPFYEKYDTLEKLESYFDCESKTGKPGFRVVPAGKRPGEGHWCCIAAVLCILGKYEKLQRFLEETDKISDEPKSRINEYISKKLGAETASTK